ncbi:Sodium/calcium exchanger protein-domain-containing protein [Pisolithus marmoratus]|nr:Sodium/calcium exchanger protein-domain-containing protein [Pisolithus marmoratus]
MSSRSVLSQIPFCLFHIYRPTSAQIPAYVRSSSLPCYYGSSSCSRPSAYLLPTSSPPNLATIAQFLGLDENVAGVTFLAFGNASPDVFSTFSAMRADSGSLAIGELLGAASFIISCVVGSMCIIRPFKIYPLPFLRDVGFFTVTIIMLLVILRDGLIQAWESAILVLLYVCYVLAVAVGSWLERRMERVRLREAIMRVEYSDEPIIQPYTDEESYRDELPPAATISTDHHTHMPSFSLVGALEFRQVIENLQTHAASSSLDIFDSPSARGHQQQQQQHISGHSESRSPSRTDLVPPAAIVSTDHHTHMPSSSNLGALEFHQVVESLKSHTASSSLDVFDPHLIRYAGGHYYQHRYAIQSDGDGDDPSRSGPESHPWDTDHGVPLDTRAPRLLLSPIAEDREREESERPSALDEGIQLSRPCTPLSGLELIPSIPRTPESLTDSGASVDAERYVPPTKGERTRRVLARACHILFPTLHLFWSKTLFGKDRRIGWKPRLVGFDFEEEGVEGTPITEEVIQEDFHEMKFNKWLVAAQCVFGPLFCVVVLFRGTKHLLWSLIGTVVGGICAGFLVLIFADRGVHPAARMAQCSMGLFVAIVWIMAIANEVVNVLQTFGFILGFSDAIIGLTIFALGNSLTDLVANMSVAVFAPIMGFSACFSGPLVNILLGVGISGSYIILQTPNAQPYRLHSTPSLISSAFGLLGLLLVTLIGVPLNGYILTRKWGVFLVVSYVVLMAVNIFVEVKYSGRDPSAGPGTFTPLSHLPIDRGVGSIGR